MGDRSLDSLSSVFYPKACELIARVTARGVAVMVVQTSRTEAEHVANLANGTSGTSRSLHLARRLRLSTLERAPQSAADLEKSDAIDLAPFEQYQLHGPDKLQWDTKDPAWAVIVEEAERLGLRSGGRWRDPFDPGHAELLLPMKRALVREEQLRPWPWPQFRST